MTIGSPIPGNIETKSNRKHVLLTIIPSTLHECFILDHPRNPIRSATFLISGLEMRKLNHRSDE
jgi:hypothetical protein